MITHNQTSLVEIGAQRGCGLRGSSKSVWAATNNTGGIELFNVSAAVTHLRQDLARMLAHMRRIVNISGLQMKASTQKNVTVDAQFNAVVYMQNPQAFQAMEKKS